MPPKYRADSLVADDAVARRGLERYEVLRIPFAEERADLCDGVQQSELFSEKRLAIETAKKNRREQGGCWMVRVAGRPAAE